MMLATHCMLHRQSPGPHSVLSNVVTVVNHIKSKPLQCCLFGQLCREMGAGQDRRPSCSTQRCVGSACMIKCYSGCMNCAQSCANSSRMTSLPLQHFSRTPNGSHGLLNKLNLSLQDRYASILEVSVKIKAFRGKRQIWRRWVRNGIINMFPQFPQTKYQLRL